MKENESHFSSPTSVTSEVNTEANPDSVPKGGETTPQFTNLEEPFNKMNKVVASVGQNGGALSFAEQCIINAAPQIKSKLLLPPPPPQHVISAPKNVLQPNSLTSLNLKPKLSDAIAVQRQLFISQTLPFQQNQSEKSLLPPPNINIKPQVSNPNGQKKLLPQSNPLQEVVPNISNKIEGKITEKLQTHIQSQLEQEITSSIPQEFHTKKTSEVTSKVASVVAHHTAKQVVATSSASLLGKGNVSPRSRDRIITSESDDEDSGCRKNRRRERGKDRRKRKGKNRKDIDRDKGVRKKKKKGRKETWKGNSRRDNCSCSSSDSSSYSSGSFSDNHGGGGVSTQQHKPPQQSFLPKQLPTQPKNTPTLPSTQKQPSKQMEIRPPLQRNNINNPVYQASFNYAPQESEDIQLVKGQLYVVLERDVPDPGWCRVKRVQPDNRNILFNEGYCPMNYITLVKN
jgi:hypothetical protein